jgi:hypothetical protein
MTPKLNESALAQEIVDAAVKQYKGKLTNGKEHCVGIVQVTFINCLHQLFGFLDWKLFVVGRRSTQGVLQPFRP